MFEEWGVGEQNIWFAKCPPPPPPKTKHTKKLHMQHRLTVVSSYTCSTGLQSSQVSQLSESVRGKVGESVAVENTGQRDSTDMPSVSDIGR